MRERPFLTLPQPDMKKNSVSLLVFLCGMVLFPFIAAAQTSDEEIQVRLNKDWGYGGGGQIQGAFSYDISAPSYIVRVEFLLDGESIGEDTEAPFEFQFDTDSYAPGIHTLSVIGYGDNEQVIRSNSITRQFLTSDEARAITVRLMAWIILPVLGLMGVALLVSFWSARNKKEPGRVTADSIFGAAICPKCERPFALHIWKLNLGFSALDRCPHCGKWSLVRRASAADIEAAEQAIANAKPTINAPLSPEDALRKQLDDSRFDTHK